MLEDKSKKVSEGVEELDEEELDLVAGGAYTQEQWNSMTTAERQAAQRRSLQAKRRNEPCEMD